MDVRVGGVLIGILIVLSEYLGVLLGVVERPYLNIVVLILGAFFSASLFREFSIKIFSKIELIKSLMGGCIMGIGAFLALGDNLTGFLMGLVNLSAGALVIFLGLVLGGLIGIKYQLWELERYKSSTGITIRFPKLNLIFALVGLALIGYFIFQDWRWGLWILLGVLLQRSKWCMVNTFKEPFFHGTFSYNLGWILTLLIGVLGIAFLKFYNLIEPNLYVLPNFGVYGLLGGFLFGLGMMLVNGCGASLLYKTGEGDLKSLLALVCFLGSYHLLKVLFPQVYLYTKEIFLPTYLGYLGTLGLILVFLSIWLAVVWWNSKTKRFFKRYLIF